MEFKGFLMCLIVCFFLSFFIGIERQYRRRIIGLRTTILVSIGSFLFVSMSFSNLISNSFDATRIAAQVVSGIGFLGAGVIIKDGAKVQGLTTAATLWCDAAIGVLCASGMLLEAISGTIIILFSNTILRYVNKWVNNMASLRHIVSSYELTISCKENESSKIVDYINKYVNDNKRMEIISTTINNNESVSIIKTNINIKKIHTNYFEKMISNINHEHDLKNITWKINSLIESEEEEM